MSNLLSLNDDCLYALCEAASRVHAPRWTLPTSDTHDWPADLSTSYIPERRFCLAWVILSHVCQRLRRICLDSPALWADAILALPSPDAWDGFVERARDRPLELCVPTHNCRMEERIHLECRYLDKIWFAEDLIHRARNGHRQGR